MSIAVIFFSIIRQANEKLLKLSKAAAISEVLWMKIQKQKQTQRAGNVYGVKSLRLKKSDIQFWWFMQRALA